MNFYDYMDDESRRMEENGWVHKDDLPDLDHVRDMLQGLVEGIYETGNIEDIEFCMEEILHQFRMKFSKDEPIIQKALKIKKIKKVV